MTQKPFSFKRSLLIAFSVCSLCVSLQAREQSPTSKTLDAAALDKSIESALDAFYTPGMSVAVVKDGEVIYEKGFGLANIAQNKKVDKSTYFRLASTSKAFTAAAVAILVDEKKLQWDDLLIDHIPEFRLQDSYATRHFTIKDLLTHKSGLASGVGDSMIWPEPSGFTRDEVIERLRYFTPDFEFRERYAYSNVMYITAGEVVERVSGIAFEEFVDTRIFEPLGMTCFAGDMPPSAVDSSAMAYGHNDVRGIYPIPRNAIYGDALMSAAAGGMVCNAQSMAKWLQALLKQESLPFSSQQLANMWSSETILGVSSTDTEWDGTHFKSYGLGWRLANYGPYKHISHTGTLSGYQAFVALIPELDLGAVVLNNGSNYGARGAVMQSILKSFIDQEQQDWVLAYQNYQDEREQAYLARLSTPEPVIPMTLEAKQIIGVYKDTWFGQIHIDLNSKNELQLHSSRMTSLKGRLEPFQGDTFKVVWDNQNAASDAFLNFELSLDRDVQAFVMHPFSTRKRHNHTWRDMYFVKQKENME